MLFTVVGFNNPPSHCAAGWGGRVTRVESGKTERVRIGWGGGFGFVVVVDVLKRLPAGHGAMSLQRDHGDELASTSA